MSRSNERRPGGDRARRGGDRESGERFLFPVEVGTASAGSGVGRRTAEAMTSAMLWKAVGLVPVDDEGRPKVAYPAGRMFNRKQVNSGVSRKD